MEIFIGEQWSTMSKGSGSIRKAEVMKSIRRLEKEEKHGNQSASLNPDKNECFVMRTCALYLDRLLKVHQKRDSETMTMLAWILGPDIELLTEYFLDMFTRKERERYQSDLAEAFSDPEEAQGVLETMLRKSGRKNMNRYAALCREMLLQRRKTLAYSGLSDTEKKINGLAKMFNMSEQEKSFSAFLTLISLWQQAEEYFVDHLHCQTMTGRRLLKVMLDMTDKELDRAMSGTLANIEFFELDRFTFKLSDDFIAHFEKPSSDFLVKNYFTGFSRKTIPLENHLINPKVTENLLTLLGKKRESPNHILLYGSPGTGKTSYALGLAKKLGVPAYEIQREKDNTTSTRRAAIIACLNMTNNGDGSLIVVDEADNLLNTKYSWFSRGETQDKGWLNKLLEESGTRMIWITNSICDIEESVQRRFAFSIHFRHFNQQQRIGLWESILRKHRVKRFYDAGEIYALASRYSVSAAVIDMVVRKALETSLPDQASFKGIVTMNLDSYVTLANGGHRPGKGEAIEHDYSLEGLNVEGDLPLIMANLKEFDRFLRRSDQQNAIRNFNLLFYGPPGTGKSELARYVAENLNRELIVKRASDIVSPYVGETEQNIKNLFSEAEHSEAVLVVDEADSFLFSRPRAIRSWEISHTNEFLTQMERFRGILICTTNRFTDLDQASVRRFNYKIGFGHLKPDGNVVFYRKLLCPLTRMPLDQSHEARLGALDNLTPGDFRVVRDRYHIAPSESVTHDMMVQALEEESRIKAMQEGRKHVGFLSVIS